MYWGNFNLMHQLNQNIVQLFSERTFFFHQSIFFWKINFIRMFSVQQSIFMDLGNSSLEAEVFSTYFELWLFDFFWRKKFLQILLFVYGYFQMDFINKEIILMQFLFLSIVLLYLFWTKLKRLMCISVLLFFYQQSKLCGDVFNVLGKSMELFSTITSRYIYNYTLIKSWILDKWVFYEN